MYKVTSELGEKEIRAFSKHQFQKTFIFGIALTLLFITLGVIEVALYPEAFYGYFFLVFGVVYAPLIFLLYNIELKKNLKVNALNGVVKIELTFDDKTITDNTFKDGKQIQHTELEYSSISKINFDKEYVYVYLNRIQAYTFSRTDVTNNVADALILLIQNKVNENKLQKKLNKQVKN